MSKLLSGPGGYCSRETLLENQSQFWTRITVSGVSISNKESELPESLIGELPTVIPKAGKLFLLDFFGLRELGQIGPYLHWFYVLDTFKKWNGEYEESVATGSSPSC
ncbi:uncharacterized protein LOC129742776 isoform X2 [Uranotaenia lowii]|uniref:uncharacterized protein LOC129742776 isoform X2 n=1 Tax=Uranotaenia lowii TaxID=190385 RepID=UPI00247A5B2A|nr:uncharacterized protein LOC129742776 isoform X2 [Uranotaenia lowii]